MKVKLVIMLCFFGAVSLLGQSARQIDEAAKLAAKEIVTKLRQANPQVERIAFYPLKNDSHKISAVIGAEIPSYASQYTYYSTSLEDWERTMKEVYKMNDQMVISELFDKDKAIKITQLKSFSL